MRKIDDLVPFFAFFLYKFDVLKFGGKKRRNMMVNN